MNKMLIGINEAWRKFFKLPMSDDFLDLKLEELKAAENKARGPILEPHTNTFAVQEHCCTIYWDIDDPRRRPDRSKTVNSRKMCEDWRRECKAKDVRDFMDGAC
jgi:hypothetical protein